MFKKRFSKSRSRNGSFRGRSVRKGRRLSKYTKGYSVPRGGVRM